MICPACEAGPLTQQPDPGGEPVWLCMVCGLIYSGEDRLQWFNFDSWADPHAHDGWDGAAGAEIRDDHYEPYPHAWDYSLRWCRIKFALGSGLYSDLSVSDDLDHGRHPLDIPAWIIRRALVALPEGYRQPEIW